MIDDGATKLIAKFSATGDLHNVVKAEYVAMRLAALAGLDVAPVRLARALGKDVFMVERFDRAQVQGAWHRKALVSALTILELDELMARYASYETLAEIIRHRFSRPRETLRELFGRLVFNNLCGNTDDHARNHAAFWDGKTLTLTPAYDICPQLRTGGEAGQAMLIAGADNSSRLAVALKAAPAFLLPRETAEAVVRDLVGSIRRKWDAACAEAALTRTEREVLWYGAFLQPFAFQGLEESFRLELNAP